MSTRRDFLRASSLISIAPVVPGFLARTARAATTEKDARVLVVVQLDGGNDGINTVIPFADEGYARNRKALRIASDRVLKLNDQVALHPSMRAAAELHESGRLAIVPGVGYPNPNRSHFESMAIWQSARLDPEDRNGPGWLGRGLDETPGTPGSSLYVGAGAAPVALRGRRSQAAAMQGLDEMALEPATAAPRTLAAGPADNDLMGFIRLATLDAYASADRLTALAGGNSDSARYPGTGLAERLRLIARLLKGGHGARVYYTTQSGYDTHSMQLPAHADLLSELSGALKAFLDDLAAAGLADRVLVLGFSEFGRRLEENGSEGTDHGTSGPVLFAGSGVRPGLTGVYPRLTEPEDGDLKTLIDFRQVYATIMEGWLALPAAASLGGSFPPLPFLKV
jgi:uncharacterized protein (DUF1501 family)